MAVIGIDATYLVDPRPTGISIYSRSLINSLSSLDCAHKFLLCYRLSRLKHWREFLRPRAPAGTCGPEFSVRIFQEPFTFWLPWQAKVFHSLAQRPPAFRFGKEIVTVLDVFPLTGEHYSSPDFRRKFSTLLLEAVDRAVRIITPSQYTADQLVQHAPVRRDKIRVIPLGVDLPRSNMTPTQRLNERRRLVGEGREMILSVGVIQNRKNTFNALRALALLPDRYRLVLAGGDGYGSQEIHTYLRRSGLGARVTVLGYVPEDRLATLYQAASLFLFPSLEEGFGIPVLEAMAYGLPVVTSRTSSLPEVGGDAALYIEPRDPTDIAEKVARLTEDVQLREKLIARGLARARIFSWRRVAEKTCEVYDEVLAM
jgi:glycosyltransferase involved in cell wall biosynthesis